MDAVNVHIDANLEKIMEVVIRANKATDLIEMALDNMIKTTNTNQETVDRMKNLKVWKSAYTFIQFCSGGYTEPLPTVQDGVYDKVCDDLRHLLTKRNRVLRIREEKAFDVRANCGRGESCWCRLIEEGDVEKIDTKENDTVATQNYNNNFLSTAAADLKHSLWLLASNKYKLAKVLKVLTAEAKVAAFTDKREGVKRSYSDDNSDTDTANKRKHPDNSDTDTADEGDMAENVVNVPLEKVDSEVENSMNTEQEKIDRMNHLQVWKETKVCNDLRHLLTKKHIIKRHDGNEGDFCLMRRSVKKPEDVDVNVETDMESDDGSLTAAENLKRGLKLLAAGKLKLKDEVTSFIVEREGVKRPYSDDHSDTDTADEGDMADFEKNEIDGPTAAKKRCMEEKEKEERHDNYYIELESNPPDYTPLLCPVNRKRVTDMNLNWREIRIKNKICTLRGEHVFSPYFSVMYAVGDFDIPYLRPCAEYLDCQEDDNKCRVKMVGLATSTIHNYEYDRLFCGRDSHPHDLSLESTCDVTNALTTVLDWFFI